MNKLINKTSSIAIIVTIILLSCKNDTVCEYDQPTCQPAGITSPNAGLTVVTYNGNNSSDFVGSVYDTRNNVTAPYGSDWGPILNAASKVTRPADWTVAKIGRVFGITVDDNSNIYLAASGMYNRQGGYSEVIPYANAVPGAIYKANASGYATSLFATLPISASIGQVMGIGNIAFDKANKQLFASSLEDGKIYRISMTGTILDTYDPWTADPGIAGVIAAQDEQVWGIGVNYENGKVKIYFARIENPIVLTKRNMYSITLNADGSLPASSTVPTLEIANLLGNQEAITDIEFSSNFNKMVFAERGDPHNAITMSYNRMGSTWVTNTQYFVGGITGNNAAGGVDFAYKGDDKNSVIGCDDDFIWASGNYFRPTFRPYASPEALYGIQGIKYAGNIFATAPTTDLYIDFDNSTTNYIWNQGQGRKTFIGDVDVIDADGCFCIPK